MMYDLSSKFNTFYNSYVVLPQEEQSNLYNKKELNIIHIRLASTDLEQINLTSFA